MQRAVVDGAKWKDRITYVALSAGLIRGMKLWLGLKLSAYAADMMAFIFARALSIRVLENQNLIF